MTPGRPPATARDRLRFVHFSGVGPRLYADLFQKDSRKDDDGLLLPHAGPPGGFPLKVMAEYLDSYRSFEAKVADLFDSEFAGQPPSP